MAALTRLGAKSRSPHCSASNTIGLTLSLRVPKRHAAIVCCSSSVSEHTPAASRRHLLASVAAGMLMLSSSGDAHAEAFLTSTGAKGPLAEEEQRLYQLRVEKEGQARRDLEAERDKLENEARESQIGKLCATPFGVDIVGITELVGLVGALVGGITARQRKIEVEKLNEQLRTINLSLRQQARAGTVYAPGLTYAPALPKLDGQDGSGDAASTSNSNASPFAIKASPSSSQGSAVASASTSSAPQTSTSTATATLPLPNSVAATTYSTGLLSMEEESMSPDAVHCRDALRAGKRLLKEQNGAAAMVRFEKALMLSKALKDQVQERRAMRGLAAAARLQQQYRAAIKHLERVLEISGAIGEYTGDADAFGTIADCYTDLGEFDRAAVFYDKYIDRMSRDGPV